MNYMKVNPTEKRTEMFYNVDKKILSKIYENIPNYNEALSFKKDRSLFFSGDLVILSLLQSRLY